MVTRRGTGHGGPQALPGPRTSSGIDLSVLFCKDDLLVLKADGADHGRGRGRHE
jgi:hypothetical protein